MVLYRDERSKQVQFPARDRSRVDGLQCRWSKNVDLVLISLQNFTAACAGNAQCGHSLAGVWFGSRRHSSGVRLLDGHLDLSCFRVFPFGLAFDVCTARRAAICNARLRADRACRRYSICRHRGDAHRRALCAREDG